MIVSDSWPGKALSALAWTLLAVSPVCAAESSPTSEAPAPVPAAEASTSPAAPAPASEAASSAPASSKEPVPPTKKVAPPFAFSQSAVDDFSFARGSFQTGSSVSFKLGIVPPVDPTSYTFGQLELQLLTREHPDKQRLSGVHVEQSVIQSHFSSEGTTYTGVGNLLMGQYWLRQRKGELRTLTCALEVGVLVHSSSFIGGATSASFQYPMETVPRSGLYVRYGLKLDGKNTSTALVLEHAITYEPWMPLLLAPLRLANDAVSLSGAYRFSPELALQYGASVTFRGLTPFVGLRALPGSDFNVGVGFAWPLERVAAPIARMELYAIEPMVDIRKVF